MQRLAPRCADATAAEENGTRYDFLYVNQEGFEAHPPKTFGDLVTAFPAYRRIAMQAAAEGIVEAGKKMQEQGVDFEELARTSRDDWR